jgi:hypothetical protein
MWSTTGLKFRCLDFWTPMLEGDEGVVRVTPWAWVCSWMPRADGRCGWVPRRHSFLGRRRCDHERLSTA